MKKRTTFSLVCLAVLLSCAKPDQNQTGTQSDTLPPIGPGTRTNTLLPEDTPGSVPPVGEPRR
jgi:hypothetical protein